MSEKMTEELAREIVSGVKHLEQAIKDERLYTPLELRIQNYFVAQGYLARVEQEKLIFQKDAIEDEKEQLKAVEEATESYQRTLEEKNAEIVALKGQLENDFPHSCGKSKRLAEQLKDKLGCDHLDGPYRKVLAALTAERERGVKYHKALLEISANRYRAMSPGLDTYLMDIADEALPPPVVGSGSMVKGYAKKAPLPTNEGGLLERLNAMSDRGTRHKFDVGHYWNLVEECIEKITQLESDNAELSRQLANAKAGLTCGEHPGMSCPETHLDDLIRIRQLESDKKELVAEIQRLNAVVAGLASDVPGVQEQLDAVIYRASTRLTPERSDTKEKPE